MASAKDRLSIILLFVLLVSLEPALLAQSVSDLTFKAKSELIVVPADVTRDGKPVRGLKRDDFVVRSNGKIQEVRLFQEIEAADPTTAHSPSGNVVRNRPGAASTEDTTIVVVDLLNARSVTKLHHSTVEVLQQYADIGLPVSVLAIGKNGLVEIHPLSAPTEHLKSLIRLLSENPGDQLVDGQDARFSPGALAAVRDLSRKQAPRRDLALVRRVDFDATTLVAVEEILRAYAPLPGRKKLIWITQQVPRYLAPLEVRDVYPSTLDRYTDSFRQATKQKLVGDDIAYPSKGTEFELWAAKSRHELLAWKRLNDANFRVMPIIDLVPDVDGKPPLPGLLFGIEPCPQVKLNGMAMAKILKIDQRAPDVCYDDPSGCALRAAGDRHYYILGFYLRGETKPGIYKLQVRVADKSVRVSSRQGFAVMPLQSRQPGASLPNPADIASLFSSPLDISDIPLSLEWSTGESNGPMREVPFTLSAAPGAITVSPDTLSLDLYLASQVRRYAADAPARKDFPLSQVLSRDDQQQLVTEGYRYRGQLLLGAGSNLVRFLLRDNNTGRVGTVTATIEIAK